MAYKLQLIGKRKGEHDVFNISLAHPYLPGGVWKGPPYPSVEGGHQEYQIEGIVVNQGRQCRLVSDLDIEAMIRL